MTQVSNLAAFLDFKTTKALYSAIQFCKRAKVFPVNSTVFLYFLIQENPELSFVLSRLLLDKEALTDGDTDSDTDAETEGLIDSDALSETEGLTLSDTLSLVDGEADALIPNVTFQ